MHSILSLTVPRQRVHYFADRFWLGNICDPVSLGPTGFVLVGFVF
jgi:hypothetical protein